MDTQNNLRAIESINRNGNVRATGGATRATREMVTQRAELEENGNSRPLFATAQRHWNTSKRKKILFFFFAICRRSDGTPALLPDLSCVWVKLFELPIHQTGEMGCLYALVLVTPCGNVYIDHTYIESWLRDTNKEKC
jgi:hypothetical protein